MNIGIDCHENEFWGEIDRYCVDGDFLWFYDEISGGLYRLDKKNYSVEVILTPMEIHQKEIVYVLQILKWKNEVYLIPSNISCEWLIYDTFHKKLKRVRLFSESYEIGNAVNIGKQIYLIPEKTNHILAIVEAEPLRIKMIMNNWYKGNNKKLACWGYSIFNDKISFPIIGTKEIYLVQRKEIVRLLLNIKQAIYSICLVKDGIWILPTEGKFIFVVDRMGKLIEAVEIRTGCPGDTAEHFTRIIAVDKYVFLFPKQGGRILALEKCSNNWFVIGRKDEPLYRTLYQKSRNLPYWGCYYKEEKLYILPKQYRFAEVNMEAKSVSFKVLPCAAPISQQYMMWVHWFKNKAKINLFVEWEKNSLQSFLQNSLVYNFEPCTKFIGKDIWENM